MGSNDSPIPMNKLFQWITGRGQELLPLEQLLLQKVETALSKPAAEILVMQITLINKVQRLDKSREVDFYRMEKGKPVFPESALFPNHKEEFELARLRIVDPRTGHGTNASVYLVKGRLFSIEFSCPPGDISDLGSVEMTVESIMDPMIE